MSHKRWVVTERAGGGGTTLSSALTELEEVNARSEGRAFVNGVRATREGAELRVGDVVEVWAARSGKEDEEIAVVAFQYGLLVAEKPASLPTTPDHRGARSVVSEVEAWLSSHAPELCGQAHPVSRLDVGVSGLVLFALTPAARKLVERANQSHAFVKRYIGIARGLREGETLLEGAISRRHRGVRARPLIEEGGKPSQSKVRALGVAADATLVELVPLTGRTHQLRLHLAEAKAPLFGDRAHGGSARVTLANGSVRELDRIMLHASSITLAIPKRPPLLVTSPIPAAMMELWSLLDGDPLAWNALAPPR